MSLGLITCTLDKRNGTSSVAYIQGENHICYTLSAVPGSIRLVFDVYQRGTGKGGSFTIGMITDRLVAKEIEVDIDEGLFILGREYFSASCYEALLDLCAPTFGHGSSLSITLAWTEVGEDRTLFSRNAIVLEDIDTDTLPYIDYEHPLLLNPGKPLIVQVREYEEISCSASFSLEDEAMVNLDELCIGCLNSEELIGEERRIIDRMTFIDREAALQLLLRMDGEVDIEAKSSTMCFSSSIYRLQSEFPETFRVLGSNDCFFKPSTVSEDEYEDLLLVLNSYGEIIYTR